MDDVIQVFVDESMQSISRMRDVLSAADRLDQDPGVVEDFFCAVHSVKGACGFLGLGRIETVATAGEHLLHRLKENAVPRAPGLEGSLLDLTEAIITMLDEVRRSGSDGHGDDTALIADLERLADGRPAVQSAAGRRIETSGPVATDGGRRALVVDDSKAMRRLLSRTLQGIGFSVIEAGSAEEGLAFLKDRAARPDVVLIDWTLPEMDGIEFVRAARGVPELATIPVVMVTSETAPPQVEQAFAAGVDRYVMKPFTKDKITAAVGDLCPSN